MELPKLWYACSAALPKLTVDDILRIRRVRSRRVCNDGDALGREWSARSCGTLGRGFA